MIELEPNKYYHIYNRGNNREQLFYTKANYEYFLNKFIWHCYHIFKTYSYCLLNNHFHMVVSVRNSDEQNRLFESRNLKTKKLRTPSRHIAHFFSSYTQSINRQEDRVGSLFQKNFKRKEITSEEYFQQMIVYSHLNPVKHGFTKDYRNYPYSSYQVFLNSDKTLQLFGGLDNFVAAHENEVTRF